MKKSVRTAVIVALSLGLLAIFLRGAHLDVVWREIRQADAWLIAVSAVLFFDPGMAVADRVTYRLVRTGGLVVGGATLLLLCIMFFAARDPRALGRWAYKLEHLLPGKLTHTLAGLLHSFAEGLAVVRAPKRLAVALMLSVPLWMAIALGVWTVLLGFHIQLPFTGSFLLLALLAVGVSVPTPGGVGGFEAAIEIGLTRVY